MDKRAEFMGTPPSMVLYIKLSWEYPGYFTGMKPFFAARAWPSGL